MAPEAKITHMNPLGAFSRHDEGDLAYSSVGSFCYHSRCTNGGISARVPTIAGLPVDKKGSDREMLQNYRRIGGLFRRT
jgi:hypothetical protein